MLYKNVLLINGSKQWHFCFFPKSERQGSAGHFSVWTAHVIAIWRQMELGRHWKLSTHFWHLPWEDQNSGSKHTGPFISTISCKKQTSIDFGIYRGSWNQSMDTKKLLLLMGASLLCLLSLYDLTTPCSSLLQPLPPYLGGSWTSHVVGHPIGSQSKGPKREQQMLHPRPYLTCSWKAYFITSTVFCSLRLLKRALPLREKDIVPAFWWKEGQKNYSHVFKLLLRHQSTS